MNSYLKLAVFAVAFSLPMASQAHRAWILPAATVLSSDDPWVTFDAAISNDIFHTDFNAMNASTITVLAPDRSTLPLSNMHQGKHRTTFDLQLTLKGTYRIFTASQGLNATWEENGTRKRWPARGTTPTPEAFAAEVPKKADKLVVTQSSRRIETFVTAGTPSNEALAPSNLGLELVPVTHPNDLFAGEPAQFRFLIDGKPAQGVKIEVMPGGMRYRNAQNAIEVVSGKDGTFSVTWPQAGQYYLEAEYEDEAAAKPATKRRGTYAASFEVLPQ